MNPEQTLQIVNAGDLLADIALGAVLGMVGQIIRLLVGLKKSTDRAAVPGTSTERRLDELDPKRAAQGLLIALMVGVVCGVLLSVQLFPTGWDRTTMLTFIAAGYSGTDFIEGFIKRHPPA